MRRLLGALVLVLLTALTACGEEDPPTASDPAPSATTSSTSPTSPVPTSPVPTSPTETETATDLPTTAPPTKSPPLDPGGVAFELVEIVSGTAAGGQVSPGAVALDSPAAVEAFVAPFRPALAADVTRAARGADGGQLYAAVVGLGCDVPPGVTVAESAEGYTITGTKVPDPTPECFAAVTSVAIVTIPG